MIGRLNHVAIAVRDIDAATKVYRDTLSAAVSDKVPQPAHGVTTVFVNLPNTKIELLEPPVPGEFGSRLEFPFGLRPESPKIPGVSRANS